MLAHAQCSLPSPNAGGEARYEGLQQPQRVPALVLQKQALRRPMPAFYFSFCPSFLFISLKLYAISQVYPHGFGFHQHTYKGEAIQERSGNLEPVLLPCAPEPQGTSLTSAQCPHEQSYEIQFLHQFFKKSIPYRNKQNLRSQSFLPFFLVSAPLKAWGVGRKRFFQ